MALVMAGWGATGTNAQAAARTPTAGGEPSSEWLDVSNTLGFPLGGLGTGFSAFGQYGFVHVNFDGHTRDSGRGLNAGEWEYTAADAKSNAGAILESAQKSLDAAKAAGSANRIRSRQAAVDDAQRLVDKVASPSGFVPSSFGFVLREGNAAKVLQTTTAPWLSGATTFEHASTAAYLPKGRVIFTDSASELAVTVNAFTPLIPHDLNTSTIPVQIFDLSVENQSSKAREISVSLENSADGQAVSGKVGRVVFKSATGELSFAADRGDPSSRGVSVSLKIGPGATKTSRFYVAWYYPRMEKYTRYYTRQFKDTGAIINLAAKKASAWSAKIDAWHASMDVPAYVKSLWFSSLSPVETSSVMTADPFFFELETPHTDMNTMDVFVYANWVYMINWPELEKMDMSQYFTSIPKDGPDAGRVVHSLWNDYADYVEEPTFLVRLRRDALWYNDPAWTRTAFGYGVLAANRVFKEDNQDDLVVSKRGNQSYDEWKMPGISSYVNSAWVYGLASLVQTAKSTGEPMPSVDGEPADQLLAAAQASYDKDLWNAANGDWNVFYPTPGSDRGGAADSLFTDQLFGRWVVAIDPKASGVLSEDKIHGALLALYKNNLVEDSSQHFRGWVDSMQQGHVPDVSGEHAETFWLGPQINLASLLGLYGEETASLDVIRSVDTSLGSNALAGGEWNRFLDGSGNVVLCPVEPPKDTPRFAAYPRYSSAWESFASIRFNLRA
jgi:uncharacterized protein (DUF608 family)